MMTVAENCEKLNRRRHILLAFLKGLLIGLLFPLSYCLVALAAYFAYGTYNPHSPAFSLYDMLILLDSCLRFTAIGGIVFFLFALMLGKSSWVMRGVLVMLIITVLLTLFNLLPTVYIPPPLPMEY